MIPADPLQRAVSPAAAVVCALLVGLVGCGDDPFAFQWEDTPDTVLLYSLARPELNLVSGFNFREGRPVRIEAANATGNWDLAVDTRDGQLVLLPPGAFGITSRARVAPLGGVAFADVVEAPEDTVAYVADDPVPVVVGHVYVVKTNQTIGTFSSRCVYHAKMEPVVADAAGGTLIFRYVTNPVCNSRDLVPPD